MILIFTSKFDYSTSCVIRWLNFYEEKVIRLNIDDENYKFSEISKGKIILRNSLNGTVVNLLDAKSCWWRRKGISIKTFLSDAATLNVVRNSGLTTLLTGEPEILQRESKRLIEYIYFKVFRNCKINLGNPVYDLNRLIVFELASEVGLHTPDSRIISSSVQLNDIEYDEQVTKPIDECLNTIVGERRFHTYTERLPRSYFDGQPPIDLFPSLVTKEIKKKIEIRTFYIDGHFYSMAIFSQSDVQTQIDFRRYNEKRPNRTEPFKLPRDIEQKVHKLFHQLNLNTGSVDFIVDADGNYVFLEINPVGQYGMVDAPCNYQLDKKIANYLAYGNINGNQF